ncbi:hypothetical protein RugamoR57_59930 [Duganella caerulea]
MQDQALGPAGRGRHDSDIGRANALGRDTLTRPNAKPNNDRRCHIKLGSSLTFGHELFRSEAATEELVSECQT